MASEVYRQAFPPQPYPLVSYNLPFHEACGKHLATEDFRSNRVYVIASGSLCRQTSALQQLEEAIGRDKLAGVHKGMKSHTYWSEVLEIIKEVQESKAELLITLGAGSLTDAAKIVALVMRLPLAPTHIYLTLL
jgi:alcohol dehydrogenase class IV